jgi:hypothetical integral membrane protein (TIGR02206 family)
MFTTNHFIWMGICAVMISLLLLISLKGKFSRQTASRIMAFIAVASELCKIFTHMEDAPDGGSVLDPASLPLHLCSILIFLILFCAWSKNEVLVDKVASFCLPVGIWGGALAILMATSGVNFAEPYAYQCFLYHAGLLWWALHLLLSKQVDLGLKAYLRNLKVLFFMLFVMIWVNSALSVYDTNFWYVVRPPAEDLPLLNLDNGWLCYFLTLVGIGLFAVTITHLPAIVKERKRGCAAG